MPISVEVEECTMLDCSATRIIYTYPDSTIGVAHSGSEDHLWPS